jgi:hypothetical protein
MVSSNQARILCKEFFGEDLKDVHADIVSLVLSGENNRVCIIGATQIQKSRSCARALALLAFRGHGITIVAPKGSQASIQLRYAIDFISRSPTLQSQLLQGGEDKIDRLKAQQSKTFLSMKSGGYIRALTVNEGDSEDKVKSLLGQGSEIVVVEEASLISNVAMAGILRMLIGYGDKGRLIKLGNAIRSDRTNDHFRNSCEKDPTYKVFKADWHRAVDEGIYDISVVEEAKKLPNFSQYYECVFPEADSEIGNGYTRVFSDLPYGEVPVGEVPHTIGIDVGTGRPDSTVLVARSDSYAWKIAESKLNDLMAQIGVLQTVLEPYKSTCTIMVDATGLGEGFADRLKELGYNVVKVYVGTTSPESRYANLKAYAYFQLRKWLVTGVLKGDFDELYEVGSKTSSDKVEKIESKDELSDRGISSYNNAEALMLTFCTKRRKFSDDDLLVFD